ncbi:glutathione S-transferase family protein [Salinarimonas ramus]|uniref:Glutathione S-transferase n=1 Tax=Salinarimonas ramus TaxID=690164 RepID=A0A917Q6U6_9HYPH|nr:glutathione S-transferase family protein [Salinarimonas ramus]GGK31435.1 glutathione S-transferase [Salinarimonas ramus]
MKLYDGGRAPNPRRVRIFLAEKGVSVEIVPVDLGRLEHKGEAFSAVNPLQRVPALVLDDGIVITESIAICRYLEALHPEPPLFGTDPLSAALVTMWERRVEFGLLSAIAAIFRHTHPAMAEMEVPQVPEWGVANRARVTEALAFLDRRCGETPFLAGETFSVADITALVALDFLRLVKIPIPDELGALRDYHARLKSRPSAAA